MYLMSRHATSCHVTSCHVMSRDVTSCHVTSCHVTSCHVLPRHVTSCHAMSCHVMSRDVTWCHVMSRHVMSCHVMSRLAPSCHVMPRHVMSCHVTSRHVTSRRVTSYHVESRGTVTRPTLHCQLTFSTRNLFKLSMTVFVGCTEGCRYHTASAVYDLVLYAYFILQLDICLWLMCWGVADWDRLGILSIRAQMTECQLAETWRLWGWGSGQKQEDLGWMCEAELKQEWVEQGTKRYEQRTKRYEQRSVGMG